MSVFPVTIPFAGGNQTRTFADAEALAADMEERALQGAVDHRGQDYPYEHFLDNWLGEERDAEGVRQALAEAGTLLLERSSEPDVLEMVFMLLVDVPSPAFYHVLIDRMEGRPAPLPEGRVAGALTFRKMGFARLALDGRARQADIGLAARIVAFQERAASTDVFPLPVYLSGVETVLDSPEALAKALAAVAHQGVEHPGQMYPADRVRADGDAGRVALGMAGAWLIAHATHPDEVQLALHLCDNCPHLPFYHAILDRLDAGVNAGVSSEGNDVDAHLKRALLWYNAQLDPEIRRRSERYLAG